MVLQSELRTELAYSRHKSGVLSAIGDFYSDRRTRKRRNIVNEPEIPEKQGTILPRSGDGTLTLING